MNLVQDFQNIYAQTSDTYEIIKNKKKQQWKHCSFIICSNPKF